MAYEYAILSGAILGSIVLLFVLAQVIEKFFPGNRFSKFFESLVEWIWTMLGFDVGVSFL